MNRRSLLFLLFAAFCGALLGGCQTASDFPSPGKDWKTYTGQLHYRNVGGRSVIGDVVVRESAHGDFQLQFQSGPGFPLMRVWQAGDRFRVQGALARGSWSGRVGSAPKPFAGWLSLREVFAGLTAGKAAFASAGASVQATYVQKQPEHITIAAANGDRFVFHFSR